VTDTPTFDQWALLELMGHRRLAGKVSEQTIAGQGFLRIDVYPGEDVEASATQFYAPGSVYALTPVTEAVARAFATRNRPAPITRYDLPMLAAAAGEAEVGDDDVDLDDDGEPY
jgi:hypothetical protein